MTKLEKYLSESPILWHKDVNLFNENTHKKSPIPF